MSVALSDAQVEENKSTFLSILGGIVEREGLEDLIAWLERSDFFYAPASTRFHGNYDGGLCEHSLNVYKCLLSMVERYAEQYTIPKESVIVAALLHDLCKANTYKKGSRNRKNADGRWESYLTYEFDERFPGGHGEKSAFIIQQFIKLTPDEYLAIRWHMGGYDCAVKGGDRAISNAYDQCKLAAMLHLADSEASHLLEKTVVW